MIVSLGAAFALASLCSGQPGAAAFWSVPTDTIKSAPESNRLLHVDSAGNAYRASQILVSSSSAIKVWKYDSAGNVVSAVTWTDATLAPGGYYPMAIAVRESGGGVDVVVTGTAPGQNAQDYITIKYTTDTGSGALTQQWAARYNNSAQNGDDIAIACVIDGVSGDVYVTGKSAGVGTGSDYLTVKYTSAGVQSWTQRYGLAYDDAPADMIFVPGGALEAAVPLIVVTGASSNGFDQDYATIAYHTDGSLVWTPPTAPSGAVRFDGGGADFATSIAFDAYIFVTGASYRASTNLDYCTLAYDPSNGSAAWTAPSYYNGSSTDPGKDIPHKITANKGPIGAPGIAVHVTGEAWRGTSKLDYVTLQYDGTNGLETWDFPNILNISNGEDRALDMAAVEHGDVYVTGASFNGTTLDYRTRRINVIDGTNKWTMPMGSVAYDGGLTDTGICVRLLRGIFGTGENSNIWVTGRSTTLTGVKPTTIKYCQCGVLPCSPCD
ncbi:MAG: hypothetical protein AB7G11_03070 [Phycisphaerales bacterium]